MAGSRGEVERSVPEEESTRLDNQSDVGDEAERETRTWGLQLRALVAWQCPANKGCEAALLRVMMKNSRKKMTPAANVYGTLLCARHFQKCFTCINLFNPYYNPVG